MSLVISKVTVLNAYIVTSIKNYHLFAFKHIACNYIRKCPISFDKRN